MRRSPSLRHVLSLRVLLTAAIGIGTVVACGDDAETTRQAEVAERGADVMPFDLDATTHRFEPTEAGLLETVVADDPADRAQVTLIQEHLTKEAERFRRGDYSDPTAIHGATMPGLAQLEAEAGAVAIELEMLPDGAGLTFSTNVPDLVDALHRWGEAQTDDHGQHA